MASRIACSAERILYRIAGLPVAAATLLSFSAGRAKDPLQSAFAWRYWHPDNATEWAELTGSLIAWPFAMLLGAIWFTLRNGTEVRRRIGKRASTQFVEQLRLYFSDGVLAPWYYIFSLYDQRGTDRAHGYLQRFETKRGIFPLLKDKGGSPLNDKARFAAHCVKQGLPCVETVVCLHGSRPPQLELPDRDLFVKPSKGRGGRGAERWDLVSRGHFSGPGGEQACTEGLLARLAGQSAADALIVQPRLISHPGLTDLANGALATVRVVTCLDEVGQPEFVGAVFRMAIGANRTVDNLHAGGIAAAVDPLTGKLSRATNLGSDTRLGWLSNHPTTGALIEGRALPLWESVQELALRAHQAFSDRVVIGWDIGIVEDGPILIEGNGNPDMDILQRFMPEGLRRHRFADLLVYHLQRRVPALRERLCARDDGVLNQPHEARRLHPHKRQADARSARRGSQLPPEQPQSGQLRGSDPEGGGLSRASAKRPNVAARPPRARVGS